MTKVPPITWGASDAFMATPPICGALRGPRSFTRCELPPDHIVGRNHTPYEYKFHFGRSRMGKWFQWSR